MAERVYRLEFKTPLHVGTWGIDREQTLNYMPSDTLFSALVVAWSRLERAGPGARLQPFLDDPAQPPFLLSSAFPYAGPVRFLPRPQLFLQAGAEVPARRLKRAGWVSETIFNRLCQGELPAEHLDEAINFIQGEQVWLTRTEREQISEALAVPDLPEDPSLSLQLWHQAIVPRVAIDRLSSASNLFHSGRMHFRRGCGLWFAVRGDGFEAVDLALDYLADAGIGGLKGTGHGAFAYNVWSDAAEFAQPTGGDYFVSLARLAPRPQDLEQTLLAERTAYQLVTVGGWCQDDVAHSWRRRRVRLVTEGAYLNWPGYLPGALVDVTPAQVGRFTNGRRVYRYGLAYPVAAVPPQANTGGTNG